MARIKKSKSSTVAKRGGTRFTGEKGLNEAEAKKSAAAASSKVKGRRKKMEV